MYEDKNNNDIERILRRSGRKRRSARVPAAVYAGIAALVLIAAGVIGRGGKKPGDPAQTAQTGAVQAGSQEETTLSPEEQAKAEHAEKTKAGYMCAIPKGAKPIIPPRE